jgi:succinate dehydrogenase hydrophobic anchor subunit
MTASIDTRRLAAVALVVLTIWFFFFAENSPRIVW